MFFIAAGRLKCHTRVAGVSHDGDSVVFAQLIDHHLKTSFKQRKFILVVHRARNVDQKHQVGRGPLVDVDFFAFKPNPQKFVGLVPGAVGQFHVDREGIVAFGLRIVVVEVVDQFFKSNRIGWWHLSAFDEASHVSVRSGINIDREG